MALLKKKTQTNNLSASYFYPGKSSMSARPKLVDASCISVRAMQLQRKKWSISSVQLSGSFMIHSMFMTLRLPEATVNWWVSPEILWRCPSLLSLLIFLFRWSARINLNEPKHAKKTCVTDTLTVAVAALIDCWNVELISKRYFLFFQTPNPNLPYPFQKMPKKFLPGYPWLTSWGCDHGMSTHQQVIAAKFFHLWMNVAMLVHLYGNDGS